MSHSYLSAVTVLLCNLLCQVAVAIIIVIIIMPATIGEEVAATSSASEIFQFTLFGHISFILRCSIVFLLRWQNIEMNKWLNFMLDFGTLIVPTLLCSTVLSDHIGMARAYMLAVSPIVFYGIDWYKRDSQPVISRRAREACRDFVGFTSVSIFRSYVLLATAVCILAVDLPIFPVRFRKTESFGFSLMDVGIGMVIFSNGLVCEVARQQDVNYARLRKRFFALGALGACRTLLLLWLNYPFDEKEYGKHWNFFLTLAVVKVVGEWMASKLQKGFSSTAAGLTIALMLEICLQCTRLQDYILVEPSDRENGFLSQNREGLVSTLGGLAIFLASVDVGRVFHLYRYGKLSSGRTLAVLFCLTSIFGCLHICCSYFGLPVSRRIANAPYVFWMCWLSTGDLLLLFVAVFFVSYFYFHEGLQTKRRAKDFHYLYKGSLWEAINRSGLVYFLLCNAFTGIVRMVTMSIELDVQSSLGILFSYALLTSLLARAHFARLDAAKAR